MRKWVLSQGLLSFYLLSSTPLAKTILSGIEGLVVFFCLRSSLNSSSQSMAPGVRNHCRCNIIVVIFVHIDWFPLQILLCFAQNHRSLNTTSLSLYYRVVGMIVIGQGHWSVVHTQEIQQRSQGNCRWSWRDRRRVQGASHSTGFRENLR